MTLQLSILTLNIWGIPYVSKDRTVRVDAIGDVLASGKYDVVSLQEVWSDSDYQTLRKRAEAVLPFAHYFYSGVVGSGLAILSKYPIVSAFFHSWSVNGYVHRIQHGDWFGGKGVGLAKIAVGGQLVHVYVAHLHAEYNRECDDYMAHRVIQAYDTAQFIESTRGNAAMQILAGDLNTEPGDLAYRVLQTSSKLTDCCEENTHASVHLRTNEVAKNSYTDKETAKRFPNGKTIDYIMYRFGDNHKGQLLEYNLPLAERIPGKDISYSDHEAVHAMIKMEKVDSSVFQQQSSRSNGTCKNYNEEAILALEESIAICNESLKQLESHKRSYTLMAIAIIIVLLNMLELEAPYGLKTAYLLLKFILCGSIIFFAFMATIWNLMEKHGILAGKLSMEVALRGHQAVHDSVGDTSIAH
ncbi:putative neutral sphingomyelinase [Toxorhynchites rutilus septentrionalis]|uniref:putative neutral sphingomyelinase n=1 Tax=Toxorhynchites rutilus septentrionalis TaxID=329112 RepID=UPI002479EFCE|nr:putative neutral sphingomyelinase [Toxorhynchites rutilus septentrionalis]